MSLLRDIRTAVQAVWTANWPHPATYPVHWADNSLPVVPEPADDPHWLELELSYGTDQVRAYGAGRLSNERLQSGSVVIRVFAAAGAGENTALDLLSDAVATLRSRRDGALSFIGAIANLDGDSPLDGNWWVRTAVVAFEYRHAG